MQTQLNLLDMIDETEWRGLLEKIKGTKIIVFGASPIAQAMINYIPCDIEYYIDNDKKKWGSSLSGVPVYPPHKLADEKERLSILITSSFYNEIYQQLKELRIVNYQAFNLNNILIKLKGILQFSRYKSDFHRFINKASRNSYKPEIVNTEEPIGVVVYSYIFSLAPFYFLTLAVLLKLRGHDVQIIWDDISRHTDMLLDWEGASIYQDKEISESINLVSNKFGIGVVKVSDMQEISLNQGDLQEIERLADLNTVWKYRVTSIPVELLPYKESYNLKLTEYLRKVKALFSYMKFKRLIVFTGLYDTMGLYTWMGKLNRIDVASCDIGPEGGLFSANGPCGHRMDSKKMLLDGYVNSEVKKQIVNISKEMFDESINTKGLIVNGSCQVVSYSEDQTTEAYDIVIPLNISWDSAALGKNRFFSSIQSWLLETLEYVLSNTTATVAVRQHPAENDKDGVNHNFLKYNINKACNYPKSSGEDLYQAVYNKFKDNPRFRFIKCDEAINTYKLVHSAKLILPHTSTIGLEAAMMNKKVIIESDVYYGDLTAIIKASSKEDYFSKISKYLNERWDISLKSKEDLEYIYGITRLSYLATGFTPASANWLTQSIEELSNDTSVIKALKVMGEGIPLGLLQIL